MYNKSKQVKFQTLCEIQPNGDMKLIFPVQKEKTPEVKIKYQISFFMFVSIVLTKIYIF